MTDTTRRIGAAGTVVRVNVGLGLLNLAGGAVTLFYGATVLIAAWRGQPGARSRTRRP